jgi:hypothetical protein
MSHNVVPPLKSPAPPAPEAITLWNRVQHLGTLLSTEEVYSADGTQTQEHNKAASWNPNPTHHPYRCFTGWE